MVGGLLGLSDNGSAETVFYQCRGREAVALNSLGVIFKSICNLGCTYTNVGGDLWLICPPFGL